jgi:glycosyltransferase involved in cell wall biosynthesis
MSKLTIGVAIPCYKGHIGPLFALLQSIEKQTRKPDAVVVSCSSSVAADCPYLDHSFSFPLEILFHPETMNAAQNRNCAAKALTTDIISFMDADDVMHPQRLEIVEYCFQTHPVQIFLHGYEVDASKPFLSYESPYQIDVNRLYISYGAVTHYDFRFSIETKTLHNSQPSVLRTVFQRIQFDESPHNFGREDSVFCTTVVSMYPHQTAYSSCKLSLYEPSCTYTVHK